MQDADLLAQRLPDNEQRFDQLGQIGDILDQLLDPSRTIEISIAAAVPVKLQLQPLSYPQEKVAERHWRAGWKLESFSLSG